MYDILWLHLCWFMIIYVYLWLICDDLWLIYDDL
jgi:hypothetical protein